MPPKATAKTKGKPKPTTKPSGSFSLLNFFSGRGAASTDASQTAPPGQAPRNGTRKRDAGGEQGSEHDPVVISDDEREVKRTRTRVGPNPRRRRTGSDAGDDSDSDGSDGIVVLDDIDTEVDGGERREGDEDNEDTSDVQKHGFCPLCNSALPSVPSEAEAHVNACLDSGTSHRPRKPTPPPKDTTPKPITSISHRLPSPSPPPPATSKPNAFSVLMSSHKEKEVWKETESEERRDGRRSGPRKAPFYKILTGMPISVDAFCYGAIPKVTAYFLTHAHSDHYTNLSKSWKHGPIYCSHTTANLVIHMLGVDPQWVHGMPDNVPTVVPDTGGVTVTLIEANHCPGSSLFLFEGPQTVDAGDSTFRSPYVGSNRVFRYLHCGDFRACPKHVLHPAVARAPIDTVYLDTTYLNPQYCFPPQPLVIEACAALAKRAALGDDLPTETEAVKDEEDVLPPDEDNIDPDVGMTDLEGVDEAQVEEDIKPDLDSLPDTVDTCMDLQPTDVDFDVKPDIKPDLDCDVKPDVKPDIKPDIKPVVHPAELAFSMQERSAAMMEGWLVKKESGESSAEPKSKGRTLVLIGTYSIGKERIVKAVAQALGSKIYCNPRKRDILMCQADPELHDMLDTDPTKCQVHIVPLSHISLEHLQPYLDTMKPHFARILAFRPTGWTYRPPAGVNTLPDVNFVIKRDQARGFSDVSLKPIRGSSRQFMMFGVPYSEHSSFFELTCFALSVPGPAKMIATVNVHNEKSRLKMRNWFDKWAAEKNKRKERGQPGIVEYRDATYW